MVVVDLPSPRGVGVIPATTMYFPLLQRRGHQRWFAGKGRVWSYLLCLRESRTSSFTLAL